MRSASVIGVLLLLAGCHSHPATKANLDGQLNTEVDQLNTEVGLLDRGTSPPQDGSTDSPAPADAGGADSWKPITIPTGMSPSEATAMLTAARQAASARLAAVQAAHRAWAVPARPDLVASATNVQSKGLKCDGTDNTAALQSLLNAQPAGATIYFPACTYRIDGTVSINKAVTLLGAPGTILDCSHAAASRVFYLNPAGSASSILKGITITGLVIEGPGLETDPAMFTGRYLEQVRFSYVKFHNIGYAAIAVYFTTDMLVESCVFDNVFQDGLGYGVTVCDRSDEIAIRNNFFVTKSRHGVTTGTANSSLPTTDYNRKVTIENNYFEYSQGWGSAVDTHAETIGPYIVRNNVFYRCQYAVSLRGGHAEITDNLIIGDNVGSYGIYIYNTGSSAAPDLPCNDELHQILRNQIFDVVGNGVELRWSNALVQDNMMESAGYGGIYVESTLWKPSQIRIERNIVKGPRWPIHEAVEYDTVTQADNYVL